MKKSVRQHLVSKLSALEKDIVALRDEIAAIPDDPLSVTDGPCDEICAEALAARTLANEAGLIATSAVSVWNELDAIADAKEIECIECQNG